MDWYIVQYLYPKAFKRFTDVMFPNVGVISLSTLEFYDVKKLYDLYYYIQDLYLINEKFAKQSIVYDLRGEKISKSNQIRFFQTLEGLLQEVILIHFP
mgnify:CR=1 FL=1